MVVASLCLGRLLIKVGQSPPVFPQRCRVHHRIGAARVDRASHQVKRRYIGARPAEQPRKVGQSLASANTIWRPACLTCHPFPDRQIPFGLRRSALVADQPVTLLRGGKRTVSIRPAELTTSRAAV